MSTALETVGVAARRAGWDSLMAGFVPGLPTLEQAVLDTAERLSGPPRRVLDLGGGPGLFAGRMAARWPGARIVLADIDPVLLALARDGLPASVTVLPTDLADPGWPARTGTGFDLVVAVMTVHYLAPESVWSLYAGVRRVLAPGGLLVVADVMPDDGLPTVMRALDPAPPRTVLTPAASGSVPDAAGLVPAAAGFVPDEDEFVPGRAGLAWSRWWAELADDPSLQDLLAARADIFRDRPPAEFTAGPAWHADAARAAGFQETGLLWRSGRHAAFAAH
ncbi:class I SAM-dependent methyltransferase [Actinoplanes utahensis]|uniref:Methyltransferase n=1 Tax=Actinoplanes utahensis TaxID=1869 RepID=A0A0A6UXW4_ACTUT|nr:class I SAM-dependent methyltransferase [Actinoplanes utahensis]KHD79254.1 methyltransferase [Actinoplanes utahensis]GIF30318.1 hypothetical protein Aut01nite_33040 [Actinoplanes utahensis]